MPRCVPLVRQAEGAQQPQPDGAAGADVSEALATVDDTQQKHLCMTALAQCAVSWETP